MIIPGDWRSIAQKPMFKVSWVILFLNIFIFAVMRLSTDTWPSDQLSEKITSEYFKNTISEMYLQTRDPIEKEAVRGLTRDQVFHAALRDSYFEKILHQFPFQGDEIEISEAKKVLADFFSGYHKSAQYQFGLGTGEVTPWSWLTYQFMHASLIHLIGNMVLIFLCLSYLEKSVSTNWLMAVYLMAGFVGGMFFLSLDKAGGFAVVGASASAYGLMGFLLISEGTKLMPWFYLIAPLKGGYGRIHLPVFFILPVMLMTDFTALLREPSGLSANIAISAHVGGALTGMLLAVIYLLLRSKAAPHRVFSHNDRLHELT